MHLTGLQRQLSVAKKRKTAPAVPPSAARTSPDEERRGEEKKQQQAGHKYYLFRDRYSIFFGLMLVCFLLLDSLVYHRLLQFAWYLCPQVLCLVPCCKSFASWARPACIQLSHATISDFNCDYHYYYYNCHNLANAMAPQIVLRLGENFWIAHIWEGNSTRELSCCLSPA